MLPNPLKLFQDMQKLEHYMPLLENLIHSVNAEGNCAQITSWISNLRIRWSSSFTTSSNIFNVKGPKFYQVNDLYFELGMILFLYGSILRERALEVLSSDLVQSATIFRRAAGVFKYVAEEILTHICQSGDRPPEAMPCTSAIMSFICLAEAQAATARKAEENNSSGGLIAKLHYGLVEFLDETIKMLQLNGKECKPARLLDYVLSCKTLHKLKCDKHRADGLKNEGRIGVAIGVVHRALANAKKYVPKEESWRSVHRQAVGELSEVLRRYEHENEFVWHEKIPWSDELPLPQCAKIVSVIPHQPQQWEVKLSFKSVQ
ncbi:uncharacterized protein LOC127245331 isoform X2 [Andrographis paniculata]|uniref:uncharacterized protein LOC127245331 isoform X2 n=1 Tax=Andrographis paniculata TaxID=175694 RepID=UPI0021E8FD56|nr:uncharacterized protein LOC127245331 isoform X2 [Andrographis paniculata]